MLVEPNDIMKRIDTLIESIPKNFRDWPSRDRLKVERKCRELITRMKDFETELDPVALPPYMLDPSNPATFAELIARNLVFQPMRGLSDVIGSKFYGSGVYAIYYHGNFETYAQISKTDHPIYTGKSSPAAGSTSAKEQGIKLHGRLKEHAKSIDEVTNLEVSDFSCRFLVVATGWEKAAEHNLIGHYQPVWNKESKVCQGFGKHGDSASTRKNSRSAWDTIHMGRSWAMSAANKPNEKSEDQIKQEIRRHLTNYFSQSES